MREVELLRRAAALMRQRAGGADYIDGRWMVDVAGPVASTSWLGPSHDALTATWRQAEHVASWHPAVALAVAGWLDNIADRGEADGTTGRLDEPHATGVARLYLGEVTDAQDS